MPPSYHEQRKSSTFIWGVLACENDSTCLGVNLKVCSPDGRFKLHSAWHSCGLPVAFGLSRATPTAAAKPRYLKLPQGQLLWKEQFITQNKTKCQLIFTVSRSALGRRKGVLAFSPCALSLGANSGKIWKVLRNAVDSWCDQGPSIAVNCFPLWEMGRMKFAMGMFWSVLAIRLDSDDMLNIL